MIRELVKAALDDKEWNLLKLSQESGVSYSRLHDWLSDKGAEARGPSVANLEKVFAALGIKVVPPRKRTTK